MQAPEQYMLYTHHLYISLATGCHAHILDMIHLEKTKNKREKGQRGAQQAGKRK